MSLTSIQKYILSSTTSLIHSQVKMISSPQRQIRLPSRQQMRTQCGPKLVGVPEAAYEL